MSASTISKDAPSQFAALLRRSKFASYDQKIGQVYTAYGGYAHRGDWGLKRPLPNKIRVKRPMISIATVDSFNEQTEWTRRGPAARFVRQWNEMGMDQARGETGGGVFESVTEVSIDSEFARKPDASPFARAKGGGPSDAEVQVPVANVEKMRPAEFERYLDRLRKLRPKFKQFVIEKKAASRRGGNYVAGLTAEDEEASPDLHMHLECIPTEAARLPELFIAQESSLSASGTRAAWIEQRPHPIGALSYTTSSALQSHLFFGPVKGRVVNSIHPPQSDRNETTTSTVPTKHIAAVAGITATVEGSSDTGLMDFGPYSRADDDKDKYRRRNANAGVIRLRISRATVHRVPRVVGDRPEDLHERTEIGNVVADAWTSRLIPNPCIPGSADWVAVQKHAVPSKQGEKRVLSLTSSPTESFHYKKAFSGKVLNMLGTIIVETGEPKS